MNLRNTLAALLFGLAVAACGDSDGIECEGDGDCDTGQICARLASCADESCPGICGVMCSGPEDCGADEVCAETAGSGGRICQRSRTITD